MQLPTCNRIGIDSTYAQVLLEQTAGSSINAESRDDIPAHGCRSEKRSFACTVFASSRARCLFCTGCSPGRMYCAHR